MAQIIIYFSRSGNNYVNGAVKNLPVGNTEIAAHIIQNLTGADIFKLEQEKAYSEDYSECIAEAKADQKQNARPKLKACPANLDKYDTIYLGYPNYWGTMPMAVFTFLEKFDFTGKRIKPFCTHEGSGMGHSERDIRKLCPAAIIDKGLAIHGAKVHNSRKLIEKWL